MKNNITFKKIVAILLTMLIVLSACSGKPASTGDEIFDTANSAVNAQLKLFEANGKLLSNNDSFPAGTSVCDWTAMAFSIMGVDEDYDAYLSSLESYVTKRYASEGGLHRSKATEWHRIALTVMALGKNPESFGTDSNGNSVNLISDGTYNFGGENIGAQGNNAYIYALITLDSKNFSVPEGSRYSREYLLNELISNQEEDGGFGIIKGRSDIDITAMALQALAPYAEKNEVRNAIDKALAMLSSVQNDDATFSNWNTTSSESCSQIIIALCALGIDPKTDERFIKNENSVFDAFMSFRLPDGSFSHGLSDKEGDTIATEQAILALCSMMKMRDGKRLYDFS